MKTIMFLYFQLFPLLFPLLKERIIELVLFLPLCHLYLEWIAFINDITFFTFLGRLNYFGDAILVQTKQLKNCMIHGKMVISHILQFLLQ